MSGLAALVLLSVLSVFGSVCAGPSRTRILAEWFDSFADSPVAAREEGLQGNPFSGLERIPRSLREALPGVHAALPSNITVDQDLDLAVFQPYATRVGICAIPGVALALLSLIAAVMYLPVGLCCWRCRSGYRRLTDSSDLEVPDREVRRSTAKTAALVAGLALVVVVAVLGITMGTLANVHMGRSLEVIGNRTLEGISAVGQLSRASQHRMNTLPGKLDWGLARLVKLICDPFREMMGEGRSLQKSFVEITKEFRRVEMKIKEMPEVARPVELEEALVRIGKELNNTNGQLKKVVANMNKVADRQPLKAMLAGQLNSSAYVKVGDFNKTLGGYLVLASNLTEFGEEHGGDLHSWDSVRFTFVNVLLFLPLVAAVVAFVRAWLKQRWLLHVTACLLLMLVCLLFLLCSMHFVLATVVGDTCVAVRTAQIPEVAVELVGNCSVPDFSLSEIVMPRKTVVDALRRFESKLENSTRGFEWSWDGEEMVAQCLHHLVEVSDLDPDEYTTQVVSTANSTLLTLASFMAHLENFTSNVTSPVVQVPVELRSLLHDLLDDTADSSRCPFLPQTIYSVDQLVCKGVEDSLDVLWLSAFIVACATVPLVVLPYVLLFQDRKGTNHQPRRSDRVPLLEQADLSGILVVNEPRGAAANNALLY